MESLEKPMDPALTKDMSGRAIGVLVVLAVVISLLGTFVVLNELSGSRMIQREEGAPAQGAVQLTVRNPKDELKVTPKPTMSGSTGYVMLQIEHPPVEKKKATAQTSQATATPKVQETIQKAPSQGGNHYYKTDQYYYG